MSNAATPDITPRMLERFWAKVDKRDPFSCWPWTASISRVGYGQIAGSGRPPTMHLAHRVSYQYHRGPIPVGLQLDHLCGNRRCVNPNHLEAVTQQENLRRGKHVKLSVDDVNMILASPLSTHQLAAQLNVHHSTIWRIRSRVGWKPIPGHPQYQQGRPTTLEEARGRVADLLPESVDGTHRSQRRAPRLLHGSVGGPAPCETSSPWSRFAARVHRSSSRAIRTRSYRRGRRNMIALGCDVSTRALAIAGVRDDDRRSIVTRRLELDRKARGARRLVGARMVAHAALGGHATEACVIAVEVPIVGGRANNKELLAVAYVVVEAAQAACPNAVVMDVPLSTWRKSVLGRGNADKREALEYAWNLGCYEVDDDVAEALCVAEYAWQRWHAATREQAA